MTKAQTLTRKQGRIAKNAIRNYSIRDGFLAKQKGK